ncbi:MAG: substrate-binding domain-containing protein [Flavobacteriaceae bacterium]|nr:substrate-binding domain-containing protein [Flavobacteriaceae bacterium]
MMNRILFFVLLLLLMTSCKKKKETNTHNKGEITLQYDDAYINIAEALVHQYGATYQDTKINLKVSKEDQALEDLLNKKVDAIIMSRELNEKEREYWDIKTKLPWQPSYFAADAVCFVVHQSSKKKFISLKEIKETLISEKKFIFEGYNTSNFNAVMQKLNLSPKEMKFYKVDGNKEIIKEVKKYPNRIGVVSYNTISNSHSKKINSLKENIKILPIKVGDILIYPNKESLKSQEYPLTKLLYFLTNEPKFGLANGLIRYSCTSIGQKIVGREGLQPFFIYPRTIKINQE